MDGSHWNLIRIRNALIPAALMLLMYACDRQSQENAFSETGSPVQVSSPERRSLVETIDLNATTIFLKKEIVRATFQGFIERINKNIGDGIKTGDLLLEVRTKESAADDSLTSLADRDLFRGAVKIRARSNGILTALNYHTGDFVTEGEEIAIISNPASLYITLNVPYPYVARIHIHSVCQILLPDGNRVDASVDKIIPSVDPASQTQTFLLRPVEQITLPENLNVSARLPLRQAENALVVPVGAVLSNETQDAFWIMKMIDDTTAVRIDVRKGIENDSLVQVLNPGLGTNDRIIIDGAYGLPDTARVSVIR
jgi:multidrug efflux pump subunit AcrA (membrane-fusion protein)